ncbi:MAG: hypothetical protein WDN72_09155 [Alphaproteobacteria bacterium]
MADLKSTDVKAGPILKGGDLLLIDNNLLMHAGGPFVHAVLPHGAPEELPRAIMARDVRRGALPPGAGKLVQAALAGRLEPTPEATPER